MLKKCVTSGEIPDIFLAEVPLDIPEIWYVLAQCVLLMASELWFSMCDGKSRRWLGVIAKLS